MDTAPGAPKRQSAFEPAGPAVRRHLVLADEPSAAAVPVLQRTPAPALPAAGEPWAEVVRVVVAGAVVLVITAELGRRAGAPGRLTALCATGACAVVVGPWLASQFAPHSVVQSVTRTTTRLAVPRAG